MRRAGGRGTRRLALVLALASALPGAPGCASTGGGSGSGSGWAFDLDDDERVDWWEVLVGIPVLACGLVIEAALDDLVGADEDDDDEWDEPWFEDSHDDRRPRRRKRARKCR